MGCVDSLYCQPAALCVRLANGEGNMSEDSLQMSVGKQGRRESLCYEMRAESSTHAES